MRKLPKNISRRMSFTRFAAVVFLLLFSRTFYKLTKNIWQYYQARADLREEIKRNVKLKREIELVKKDYFIDYLARTELGVKKEDEIEYRFNPPKEKNEDRDF